MKWLKQAGLWFAAEYFSDYRENRARVFDTIIPKATKASEASISGKSIYAYAKDSKVAVAYDNLTKELVKNPKIRHKDEISL